MLDTIALYFPIINVFYGAFLNDPSDVRTESYARQQAACTYSDLWAEIDGVELAITPQYYETMRCSTCNFLQTTLSA